MRSEVCEEIHNELDGNGRQTIPTNFTEFHQKVSQQLHVRGFARLITFSRKAKLQLLSLVSQIVWERSPLCGVQYQENYMICDRALSLQLRTEFFLCNIRFMERCGLEDLGTSVVGTRKTRVQTKCTFRRLLIVTSTFLWTLFVIDLVKGKWIWNHRSFTDTSHNTNLKFGIISFVVLSQCWI